ncbi:MAG: hypothetical protein QM761_14405 [Pseudoxanthomonas sp.]
MSKLGEISDRALELIEQAGEKLQIGGEKAGNLIKTGAALGVARTGAKTAVKFARRNPAIAIAAGVGVGLLALAAYRRRKRAQMLGSTEGTPKRIDARRVVGTGKSRKPVVIDEDANFV